MGRRVREVAREAKKSGAGGLFIVVVGCVLVTYMFAHRIDSDEAIKTVLFTVIGTIVVIWKVFQGSNGDGNGDENGK